MVYLFLMKKGGGGKRHFGIGRTQKITIMEMTRAKKSPRREKELGAASITSKTLSLRGSKMGSQTMS
jgi:hypothetical protein